MLKKTLLALICLSLSLTGTAAQLSATLQSGDNFTPFYGANALVEAHNAAVNGDIITLSPGEFNKVDITKSITIIGVSGLNADVMHFKDKSKGSIISTSNSSRMVITADNVTLEGILALYVDIKGADNLSINRSCTTHLSDSENGEKKFHENTILTDCYIYENGAMSLSKNMVIRNCFVCFFSDCNESVNLALIENCIVSCFKESSTYLYTQPYAIYRNCVLRLHKNDNSSNKPSLSFFSPTELHDIYFVQCSRYSSTSTYSVTYNIAYGSCLHDGTIRVGGKIDVYELSSSKEWDNGNYFSPTAYSGKIFGPKDHKSEPATPSITSSQIDTETDAEGKLHVKISATARD